MTSEEFLKFNKRNKNIIQLRKKGGSCREIAKVVNISCQRVHQILKTYGNPQKKLKTQKQIIKAYKEHAKAKRKELRGIVLNSYKIGDVPICVCCGEKESRFLCIDHVNNDGAKHRRKIGPNVYVWLRNNNFPTGFQILCYNCNNGKQLEGVCPHLMV